MNGKSAGARLKVHLPLLSGLVPTNMKQFARIYLSALKSAAEALSRFWMAGEPPVGPFDPE